MKKSGAKKERTGGLSFIGAFLHKKKVALTCKLVRGDKRSLFFVLSDNGTSFSKTRKKISLISSGSKQETISDCENFIFSGFDDNHFLTYTKKVRGKSALFYANTENPLRWKVSGKLSGAHGNAVIVQGHDSKKTKVAYYGKNSIHLSLLNGKVWKKVEGGSVTPRGNLFDFSHVTPVAALTLNEGILVLYDSSFTDKGTQHVFLGGVLFSKNDPSKILWRGETPLWQEHLENFEVRPVGAVLYKQKIFVYYASTWGELHTITLPSLFTDHSDSKVDISRYLFNPVLEPNSANSWENEAAFNPAALSLDNKVHLLYRAIGEGGLSFVGYAGSTDGYRFHDRLSRPAYYPREPFEGFRGKAGKGYSYPDLYSSGGGWGGCEDPKITLIDDRIYMTYVANDGWGPPRAALTSISKNDFLNKNWNWSQSVLISQPGIVTKSACILPEKINGKYVIFHRVFPDILIDYVDDLEFDGKTKWLQVKDKIPTRGALWDSRKLSIGATPIRINEGWLVIYHAVDDRDPGRYKVGAMILDGENPAKVLYRTRKPILSPDLPYENYWKPGIVYPCGAVIKDGELLVYYGGGDRVSCVASAPIDTFISQLKQEKEITIKLKKVTVK